MRGFFSRSASHTLDLKAKASSLIHSTALCPFAFFTLVARVCALQLNTTVPQYKYKTVSSGVCLFVYAHLTCIFCQTQLLVIFTFATSTFPCSVTETTFDVAFEFTKREHHVCSLDRNVNATFLCCFFLSLSFPLFTWIVVLLWKLRTLYFLLLIESCHFFHIFCTPLLLTALN